jgi:hypothetical protein
MKLFVFYFDDGCEFAGITQLVQAESEEQARLLSDIKDFDLYTAEAVKSPSLEPGKLNPYHIPLLTFSEWKKKYSTQKDLGRLIATFDILPNSNPTIIP